MPKDETQILPLKNGSSAPVRQALAQLSHLEYLLTHKREHFNVLLQLVEGAPTHAEKRQSGFQEAIQYLRSVGVLSQDGSVRPLVRDVLLSGFQTTNDGPVLLQPFILRSEQDKQIVDAVEARLDHERHKWIGLFRPGPGGRTGF